MKKHRQAQKSAKTHHEEAVVTLRGNAPHSGPWGNPFLHLLIVLAVGVLVYSKTISVPFFFDDFPYLESNPAIRSFSFFTDPEKVMSLGINSDVKHNILLRPVAYFTFALNYAVHGLNVRGYHVVNLLLHLGNGLLVYLFARLALRTPVVAGSGNYVDSQLALTARYLPLFCALLFIGHPLQTQAVTYVIQRFVPLCTFFVLSSLVLYGYARQSVNKSVRIASYLCSLAACVLAMLSKEIAFTLPLVIAMYEFFFFDGKAGKRVGQLIPFLLTMVIIPFNLMKIATVANTDQSEAIGDAINLVNFRGTSSWDYLLTQFGVLTNYLRLLVLPINQNFDYDYQLQTVFFTPAVVIPLLLLLAIAGVGAWLLRRSRNPNNPESGLNALTAFGIFWFFLTQAVVSSFVPIDDLIFEHRAYLPSVGFFLSMLAGVSSLFACCKKEASLFSSRFAVGILAVAVILYSVAGFNRNRIWEDKLTFWHDVVSKSPNKARPHNRLGLALLDEPLKNHVILEQLKTVLDPSALGIAVPFPTENTALQLSPDNQKQVDEAIDEFRTAIRIRPNWAFAHLNLGDAYLLKGSFIEAEKEYATALAKNPKSFLPYISFGMLHEVKKEYDKAHKNYLEAIRIAPNVHIPHMSLADLYVKEGNYAEALKEYEIVWQLFADNKVRKNIAEMKVLIGKTN